MSPNNKEKARIIAEAIYHREKGHVLEGIIEAELNRLDTPKPKKWEPRGGCHVLMSDGTISDWIDTCPRTDNAGRAYPTREEAERAAKLHRMLDRLVNWLMEHCQKDIKLHTDWNSASVRMHFHVPDHVIVKWVKATESREVEL